MKIVIPGGSGQVGTVLARAFHADGHDVVVLSRASRASTVARRRVGRRERSATWAREIDGCDVVINLAGRSVNCRYTRREPARDHGLARAIDARRRRGDRAGERVRRASGCRRAPRRSTPTATTRRTTSTPACSAATKPTRPTRGDSASTSRARGSGRSTRRSTPRTRKVALRSAMTMSPDRGGIFDTLLGLVRRGLGGTRRRRPAVHVLDPRRRLRRGRSTG